MTARTPCEVLTGQGRGRYAWRMQCLLYSGGLDSACAWWILGKPPALYVGGEHGPARDANDGEQAALRAQSAMVPEFARALQRADIDHRPFMREGSWMLPRDELACLAAWARGFDAVAFAWTREDASPGHASRIAAKLANITPTLLAIRFPVVTLTKAELVARARAAGAPAEFLLASHSCVRSAMPCGTCLNCRQRQAALASALHDATSSART